MNWRMMLLGALLIICLGVLAGTHLSAQFDDRLQRVTGTFEPCVDPRECEDPVWNTRP
jgi:hypothetical protein